MSGPYPPQQPEQGGVEEALQRQIGPLKTWQWGVAVGGAVLIWRFARGNNNNPSTTVPVLSSTDRNGDPINDGNDAGGLPITTVKKSIQKTLSYYSTKLTRKTPIRNKAGAIVGYFAAGRTILLGKAVKIGGKNYYPILNMPGKYVVGSSLSKVTPVYGSAVTSTATTVTPVTPITTAQIASPTTTNLAQPYHGSLTSPILAPTTGPAINSHTAISNL